MLARLVLLIPCCCALTACVSVGPDYRTPVPAVPASWNAATPAAGTSLQHWWRGFHDATLDALIEASLKHSPDLRSAQAKLRESRASLGIARAARSPALNQNASARRNESAGAGETADSYSLGFDASWEIDIFGGTRRSVESAQATLEASEAGLRDVQLTLGAEVARNYLDLRTQQTRLAIARNNLLSLEETQQIVDWRERAGLASALDALQAASTLETARARIPALEASIEADLNTLTVLTGLTRREIAAQITPPAALPDAPAEVAVPLPADTLRQRPDLRAAERRLAAASANVGIATAALYPSLTLSGNLSLAATGLDTLLRPEALTSSLLAGLSTPLLDGGRLRRTVEVRDAQQEQALIAYERAVAQALADVETALVALDRNASRLKNLTHAADSARLAAGLARDRYAAGLIDYATLQDTLRSELSATDASASAQGDRLAAAVQLYKALGGGLTTGDDTALQ